MSPAVIEEVLRFESPGPHAASYVTRDVEVQGVKITKGSSVDFLIGAANRDHRRFVDGDRFDVKRQARPHLAFGYGIQARLAQALPPLQGHIARAEAHKPRTGKGRLVKGCDR